MRGIQDMAATMQAPALRRDAPWAERASLFEQVLKWGILVGFAASIAYPFLYLVGTSLASYEDVIESHGAVLWPSHPTLDNFQRVLIGGVVTRAAIVSIGITTVGTILSLIATSMLAYGLSRPIVGRRPMVLFVLFTLLFSAGIIPNYLLVKQLGLLNTYGALILPVLIGAFNLVVLRQFFMGIPEELIDSAKIDGAGELSVLARIVVPLSTPVLAVIALFYAVAYWNSFFYALLYLRDPAMWPLQLVVRNIALIGSGVGGSDTTAELQNAPEALSAASVLIAVVPILAIYPFLQRYFTKAVLSGAIKG